MNNNILKGGECGGDGVFNNGDCSGCYDAENGGDACCGTYQQQHPFANNCAKGCIKGGYDRDNCKWPTDGGGGVGVGGGGGCYGHYENESCEKIGLDCNKAKECLVNGWHCFTDSQCKNPYNNKHPYIYQNKKHHKNPNNFYEKLIELNKYIENKY